MFMIKFEMFYFTGNATIYNIPPIETHTTAFKSQKKAKNGRHLEL